MTGASSAAPETTADSLRSRTHTPSRLSPRDISPVAVSYVVPCIRGILCRSRHRGIVHHYWDVSPVAFLLTSFYRSPWAA